MKGPKVHISIEGFDGVGKTTVCKLLANKLGYEFVEKPLRILLDENDGTDEYIRVRDKVNACPDRDFTASFYGLGSIYMYHLFEGKSIVTDRHLCSNYAWSGNGENDDVYDFLIGKLGRPYLTVILYATQEAITARLATRNTKDPDLQKVCKSTKIYGKMRLFCQKNALNTLWLHTDNMTPEVIVDLIEERLRDMEDDPRSTFYESRISEVF